MNIEYNQEVVEGYIKTCGDPVENGSPVAASLHEEAIEDLIQKIAIGSQQIANGQTTDGEVVFSDLQSRIAR